MSLHGQQLPITPPLKRMDKFGQEWLQASLGTYRHRGLRIFRLRAHRGVPLLLEEFTASFAETHHQF